MKRLLYLAIPIILIMAILLLSAFSPLRLRDFTSEAQLRHFLEYDITDSCIYLTADKDGVIRFSGQCEDIALQLIENAEKQGWRLHFVPLHRTEYRKWYKKHLDYNVYHVIAGAVIGNEFWYIEPSNDKAWRALYLD